MSSKGWEEKRKDSHHCRLADPIGCCPLKHNAPVYRVSRAKDPTEDTLQMRKPRLVGDSSGSHR